MRKPKSPKQKGLPRGLGVGIDWVKHRTGTVLAYRTWCVLVEREDVLQVKLGEKQFSSCYT